MSMTMGMIDCTTENYDEVKVLVDRWIESNQGRRGLNKELIHIVDMCWSNYYGGVKVGFSADPKHDYYGMVSEFLINDFEDLMSVLPFSTAVLYHDDSGSVTEWFLNTKENLEMYSQKGSDIIENTRHPHICRQTRQHVYDLPTVKLLTIDR